MDEDALEEGEISDDSVHNYTPLERPSNYTSTQSYTRFPPIIESEESEEELQSSDSGSDSDKNVSAKKPKIKLKPKPQMKSKNKKYDIWSTRVQEDVLSETLNSCDVSIKDRSRAVETYDHPFHNHIEDKRTNKRTRGDRNRHLRLNKRNSNDDDYQKSNKSENRTIFDLEVSSENLEEEIARDMANKLYEEKEDLILKVIKTIGKEQSIAIFKETQSVEASGGMKIMNQTRRRTPGGVFLYLVRGNEHITKAQRDAMFDDDRKIFKQKLREIRKKKTAKFKAKLSETRAKNLPELLPRSELCLTNNPKDSDEADVINPPPTPETDGHDNSGDGMGDIGVMALVTGKESLEKCREKLQTYDEDFLDLNCSNEMDLF